jgi:hypothetical protein
MSPRRKRPGPSEPPAYLHAEVSGDGTAYLAKTQHIHLHDNAALGVVPLDAPGLRLWIARMAGDYRALVANGQVPDGRRQSAAYVAELDGLQLVLDDPRAPARVESTVRRLLAAGAAQYLHGVRRVPADALPEQVMLDFAVFALWPVITAPALAAGWDDALAELTSPRIAALVDQARQARDASASLRVETVARALAHGAFAPGVLRLLEDLADPRGAGACLTPMALADGFSPPPRKGDARTALFWLLAGAGIAVAAEPVPSDLSERVWTWLDDVAGSGAGRAHSGDGDVPGSGGGDSDPDRHRQGGGGGKHPRGGHGHHVQGPVQSLDRLIDDLFHH